MNHSVATAKIQQEARQRRALLKYPDPVEGARWIALTKGLFVLVDESDYDAVNKHIWTVYVGPRTAYAYFKERIFKYKQKSVLLHRWLLNAPRGMQVDHRDGNGLDCRRSNLRICTVAENHRNIRKQLRPTSSRFKGVTWDKHRKLWMAKIKMKDCHRHIGRFQNEEDAARAYDQVAMELFGEYALPNFKAA